MKKLALSLMMALGLVACDQADVATGGMTCGNYTVEMEFADEGSVLHAVINGDAVTLHSVVSASGAKYAGVLNDVSVALWGKGDAWIMVLNDDEIIQCGAE